MLNSAERNWEGFPGVWFDLYFPALYLWAFAGVVLVAKAGNWCPCRPWAADLPHFLTALPCACWRWERSSGNKNTLLVPSPYRHNADTNNKCPGVHGDVCTINMGGFRGDHRAALSFPAQTLCFAKQGAVRIEFRGCCCPWLEGRGCSGLFHPLQGSVLS